MACKRASWLTLAALVVCAPAVGAKVTDTCCDVGDGSGCCPKPSIADNADNLTLPEDSKLRVVYDPERCCSDESAVWCTAYGVAGCSFCKNVCDEDDDLCVVCPVADHPESTTGSGEPDDDDDHPESTTAVVFGEPDDDDPTNGDTDDLSPMDEDFDARQTPGSYDFSDDPEQYECSNCSWDGMSKVEQRLLTQRSRSMVCDSSCLHDSGDPNYGVTLCNYFKAGKECRACCHEGYMVDGCMPCEGKGSCDSCVTTINKICENDICNEECHAYVCCSMQWVQYSGCQQTMSLEVAGLAERITNECPSHFVDCETINPTCSDTARTCMAKSTVVSRRVQEVAHKRCHLLNVMGAGVFDQKYTSAGAFGSELIFRAVDRAEHFVLQSITLDACAGLDKLAFINAATADTVVARSSSGSLAWDDGTEPNPYVMNTGVGCSRHVWFLRDTNGKQDHVFITVDESEHPQFISSDWVKVSSDGKMARTDLTMFCTKEKKEHVKF